MKLVTLGMVKKLLNKDTLLDGKYVITRAEQGSSGRSESMGFDKSFDRCLMRLKLESKEDPYGQPLIDQSQVDKAWKTIQESDDRLIVVVNDQIASKITLNGTNFAFKSLNDSCGRLFFSDQIPELNALWRFNQAFWEKTFDSTTVSTVFEGIRETNPFYDPEFYFIYANRWRCFTKAELSKLPLDVLLSTKGMCKTVAGRMVQFDWTLKELVPFAKSPVDLLRWFD